jgi:polyhydroxyalkanoate synthesis repressor PhaR
MRRENICGIAQNIGGTRKKRLGFGTFKTIADAGGEAVSAPTSVSPAGAASGSQGDMAKDKETTTTIKKYANRRLYNTGTSTYVTLEDLAQMVKSGEDFVVFDAKSGEDITRSVLTQIIFEQENKGQNLLPITFLRQLIRFYGDSIQNIIPTYLDFSIDSLVRDQEKLRGQMKNAFGPNPLDLMGEQVRRNTEMFEQAMRMFLPFGSAGRPEGAAPRPPGPETAAPADSDFDTMRRQLDEMQKRLDKLSRKE